MKKMFQSCNEREEANKLLQVIIQVGNKVQEGGGEREISAKQPERVVCTQHNITVSSCCGQSHNSQDDLHFLVGEGEYNNKNTGRQE